MQIFALALIMLEIWTFENFYLKNLGQRHRGEKRDLCQLIANVELHIGEFFIILAVLQHENEQSSHTHTARERMPTIGSRFAWKTSA